MNKIYDNGTCLLGKVKQIKEIIGKQTSEDEMLIEIYEELNNYFKDNDIVCINYDNGIGYSIDYWNEDSIVKECE